MSIPDSDLRKITYLLFVPVALLLFQVSGVTSAYAALLVRMPSRSTIVTVHSSTVALTSNLGVGATHTQHDAFAWNNTQAVVASEQLMSTSLDYQNQPIMGWGADDPEPSPGVYNWSSLDARVQLMRGTKATMVLTLCCAPGWMRPMGYQDDWKNLEVAPDQKHVQDFADLTKAVVLRYPDVKYFLVWNELKGMWSTSPGATIGIHKQNRWDYERYTALYNAVYDATKSVRPEALLGGPYVVMDSDGKRATMSNPGPGYSWGTLDQRPLDVITYWLAHKHGADFMAIDGASSNKDGKWTTDAFGSAQKFVDIYNWIRLQPDGGATLPIWWAEWYAGYPANAPNDLNYYNALMASDAMYTLMSGANALFIWQPQGDSKGFSFPEGIWNDTSLQGGGQATPFYLTSLDLKNYFGPGTPVYAATVSSPTVTAMASATKMMLVNRLALAQKVIVNGHTLTLNPYQVTVIDVG